MSTEITPKQFRYVLGNYPTGVTLITAGAEEPVGLVVGTFTSVSLDPPLVGFLPAKSSTSWPQIERTGAFVVNVLSSEQESVCRDFATKAPDRFTKNAWHSGVTGAPILVDAVAHLECTIESVSDAGDHWFVVGRVRDMGAHPAADPLLFFHGGYGGFRARSMLSYDAEITRHIRLAALVKDRIEQTAQAQGCGSLVLANVGAELVVVSSFGDVKRMRNPAFAGLRQPFMAPLGMQFGAFLPAGQQKDAWVKRLSSRVGTDVEAEVEARVRLVRDRGYTVSCDPGLYARVTELTVARTEDRAAQVDEDLAQLCRELLKVNDPADLGGEVHDVWSLHAPVRLGDEVAFSIGLYPTKEDLRGDDVVALGERLLELTASVETSLQRFAGGGEADA